MGKTIKVEKLWEIQPAILSDETMSSKRIISKKRDDSDRMSLHHVVIKNRAGWKDVAPYETQDEIIYVLDGKMKISWDGQEVELTPGCCAYIPAGSPYKTLVPDEVTLICAFSPPAE